MPAFLHRVSSRHARIVLVEHNILVILNKNAVPVAPVEREKHVLFGLVVMRSEELLERRGRFPCVVVRHLGRDVVGDVGLGNTVEDVSADRTQESSVNCGEGASSESPFLGGVVWHDGVSVLKEGDQDEPVVDPKVWDPVDDSDFGKAPHIGPEAQSSKSKNDTDVGHDNLPEVVWPVHDRVGGEVVGARRILELSTRVEHEVEGPSKDLVEEQVPKNKNGCIFAKRFAKFLLATAGYIESDDFSFLLDRWVTEFLSRLGYEHLITSHVSSRSVVLAVGDTPAVERDKKRRMQDPSDGIVDPLVRRETPMAAFVCNDPNTGSEKTRYDLVRSVKGDLCGVVRNSREVESSKERIDVECCIDKESDGRDVLDDVEGRSDSGAVEAVCWDGIEELLDGKVGYDKLLSLGSLSVLFLTEESFLLLHTRRRSTLSQFSHFAKSSDSSWGC